jgi:two-component system response regulator ResD
MEVEDFMRSILVIDDEWHIRRILFMMLKKLGYDVQVAEDGKKGIELFKKVGGFDLVITDIRMPNMDGNAVARYIRNSDKSGTGLVAITGFAEKIQSDMFDYIIAKPFTLKDLRKTVRSFEGE